MRRILITGPRAGTDRQAVFDELDREAAESWADLLRDYRRRGMRAPVLAAGDGALGFWSALREVFPETREQRCWFHYADVGISGTSKPICLPRCPSRRTPARSRR